VNSRRWVFGGLGQGVAQVVVEGKASKQITAWGARHFSERVL